MILKPSKRKEQGFETRVEDALWPPELQQCDEAQPKCGHCCRHGVPCSYRPRNQPGKPGDSDKDASPMGSISAQLARFSSAALGQSSTQELEFPESRSRRLRELRLLYQYTEKTCHTLDATSKSGQEAWRDAAVQMAFTSDAMLYSILALAAQHMANDDPSDSDAQAAALEYLNLALPLHRRDVAGLNKENTDLACLTGSLLRISNFVRLQSRPIEPYTPPTQFLRQTRGSLDVIRIAVDRGYVHENPNSIMSKLILRAPFVQHRNAPALFNAANRQPLLHLLHRSAEHVASEPWSAAIQYAYEDTLSYLGAIQLTKSPHTADTPDAEGEAQPDPPFRRLVLFPALVPGMFIQLVVEAKPRALVILAHFFAALAKFDHLWWVAKTGLRELRGILTAVKDLPWEAEVVTNLLTSLNTSTE